MVLLAIRNIRSAGVTEPVITRQTAVLWNTHFPPQVVDKPARLKVAEPAYYHFLYHPAIGLKGRRFTDFFQRKSMRLLKNKKTPLPD